MCVSDEVFQADADTVSKINEVERLSRLCGGALEGLCSITIREDVRKRAIDATLSLEPNDSDLTRAAYAMADEVDLWSPDAVEDVHSALMPHSDGLKSGAEDSLKELFDSCFRSGQSMEVLAAVAHNGILRIRPFQEGNGLVARLWYSALLGRTSKVFQYISPEEEFAKEAERYRTLASDPNDIKGFVDFSLDCDRSALSRLFGSMW